MLKCKYITEKYFRLWCKNLLIFLDFLVKIGEVSLKDFSGRNWQPFSSHLLQSEGTKRQEWNMSVEEWRYKNCTTLLHTKNGPQKGDGEKCWFLAMDEFWRPSEKNYCESLFLWKSIIDHFLPVLSTDCILSFVLLWKKSQKKFFFSLFVSCQISARFASISVTVFLSTSGSSIL